MAIQILANLSHLMVHAIAGQNHQFTEGWAKFLGCSQDDVVANFSSYLHDEDRDRYFDSIEQSTQSRNPQQVTVQVLRADGEYRYCLVDIQTSSEGITATAVEIHDHQEAVQKKLQRYKLIKRIVNSLHALVSYIDTDGRYVFVNRAYEDFYDLTQDEIQGRLVKDLLGEPGYNKVAPYLEKAFAGEVANFEDEVCPPNAEDCTHVHMTYVPNYQDGGKVGGVFALGNPIESGNTANSRFGDLERFLSYWSSDPHEFSYFVGRAVGRIASHKLHDLCLAIGSSYFSSLEMCERIDFLYQDCDGDSLVGNTHCPKVAEIAIRDDVICIHDLKNEIHSRVMLIRDLLDGNQYYSLRYFVETGERVSGYIKRVWSSEWGRPTFKTVLAETSHDAPRYEEDHAFWNFIHPDEPMHGVTVYPHAEGFHDLWETKHLADFIVLVSNLLGYERNIG